MIRRKLPFLFKKIVTGFLPRWEIHYSYPHQESVGLFLSWEKNSRKIGTKINSVEWEDVSKRGDSTVWRVAYQPIWDIVKHRVIAYEALMRPNDGRSPTEVLESFRSDDQVVHLDHALILSAMHDAQALLKPRQLLMVNVEPETLNVLEFWEAWNFPLSTNRVVLEITERASLEEIQPDVFGRLGIALALDDFGTGMSNLLALERIKPAWVKMNRDFLHEHNQTGILSLMVSHCERIGARLIVEGVENATDMTFLREIHVQYAQGFYLGKPKFVEEYELEERMKKNVAYRN